jgi:hypothetical protein
MAARAALTAFIVAVSLAVTPAAWAYSEVATTAPNPFINPADCASCHSETSVEVTSVASTGEARQGPHSGFAAASRNCAGCHLVHQAPASGYLLLPGATMTETCELCHDGTGGGGVYGAIEARGLQVTAEHRTETATVIPGGDLSTGGRATGSFSGSGGTLGCGDCHSPHGIDLVQAFTTDRMRTAGDVDGFVSNQLLKRKPTGATTETPVYGSDWCAGCHAGRISGVHDVINHPVDSSATVGPTAFSYESLQVVDAVNSPKTQTGTLGRSNFGYVMPWPRTAGQGAHSPICQQCHEDGRNVGDTASGRIAADEVFSITTPDGGTASDNPCFQTFPHESQVANLLVETNDDLCTNCHPANQLP